MNQAEQNEPLIVGFVADLFFTSKIENVASRLGFRIRWIESASAFGEPETVADRRPGERLFGRQGRLAEMLAREQPALLIFDLSNNAIPWDVWIPALKASPASRRIPILCYGAHVDKDALEQARSYGADQVVPRSRFAVSLPSLIEDLARDQDRAAAKAACSEPIAAKARQGIELYNAGEFYDAHEELELAWQEDRGPGRDLYRAILQIAVAYLQIERSNFRGAMKMLLRVRQWMAPLPDVCRGVDVTTLREDADRLHAALQELGPEHIDEFDWTLFRPVRLRLDK